MKLFNIKILTPNKTDFENPDSNSFLFGFLVHYFKPSAYVASVSKINLENLKEQGIKLIICDLDNTLVTHFTKFPTKLAIDFVKRAQDANFDFIIISNNTKKRVEFFAKKLGLKEYIYNAKKPFPFIIKRYIQSKNLRPQEVVIIGDMIISDILVANFLNSESILVQPIIDAEKFLNTILKWLEKRIFIRLSKQNLIIDETKYESEFYSQNYEIL